MANERPSAGGLGPWLVGGLAVGAVLLVVILGAYALGRRTANRSAAAAATSAPATAPVAPPPVTSTVPTASGDPVAGKVLFSQTCAGCHMQDGTAAGGVGPKLEGRGLTTARIVLQIQTGGVIMPGNLVSGADLQNIAAYVASIQH